MYIAKKIEFSTALFPSTQISIFPSDTDSTSSNLYNISIMFSCTFLVSSTTVKKNGHKWINNTERLISKSCIVIKVKKNMNKYRWSKHQRGFATSRNCRSYLRYGVVHFSSWWHSLVEGWSSFCIFSRYLRVTSLLPLSLYASPEGGGED